MRCAATILLLLCGCLYAQDAGSLQSGIEGITVDAITRQPMAGVHVTMRAIAATGRPREDAETYGAISQPDGHFSITGMKPDLYVLAAQHNGYVHLPPKAPDGRYDPTVALKPGEPLKEFIVEMTPHAVIAGHVLDENGDPVQFEEVTAESTQPTRSMGGGGWAQTDERGQFRFALPPGKFYIQANANRGPLFGEAASWPPEIRSDGLTPPIYGTVFYPDAASRDKATAVELAAGQDLTGVEIHLARRRSLTISGTVTGIPAPAADTFVTVLLLSSGNSDSFNMNRESPAAPDGKFTIPGLAAGRYRVLARLQSAEGMNLQSTPVDVQPENADVTGIRLELQRGETLSGIVEIEDGSAKSRPTEKLMVRLQSEGRESDRGVAQVDEKGMFHLDDVFPEKLRLRIMPLPENAYVKSVKLSTTEAPDGVLDLTRGVNGAHLNITVSRNGGRIEGAVLGDDEQPLRGSLALVILTAAGDDIGEQTIKPVQPGEKFTYSGIRPGKYRLVAVDAREFAGDRERLKELFLRAPEIEIHEGDRIAKDIKVLPITNAKP